MWLRCCSNLASPTRPFDGPFHFVSGTNMMRYLTFPSPAAEKWLARVLLLTER